MKLPFERSLLFSLEHFTISVCFSGFQSLIMAEGKKSE